MVFYIVKKFSAHNAEWHLSDFLVKFDGAARGRRHSDDFENSSKSTKRRTLLTIRDYYFKIKFQSAFLSNFRSSGRIKIANAISKLLSFEMIQMRENVYAAVMKH